MAESPDGQLDLHDSYVNTEVDGSSDDAVDYSSSAWRRPQGLDSVAQGQQRYMVTPWYSYYPGDAIGGKEPKSWVRAGRRLQPFPLGVGGGAGAACKGTWPCCVSRGVEARPALLPAPAGFAVPPTAAPAAPLPGLHRCGATT